MKEKSQKKYNLWSYLWRIIIYGTPIVLLIMYIQTMEYYKN